MRIQEGQRGRGHDAVIRHLEDGCVLVLRGTVCALGTDLVRREFLPPLMRWRITAAESMAPSQSLPSGEPVADFVPCVGAWRCGLLVWVHQTQTVVTPGSTLIGVS